MWLSCGSGGAAALGAAQVLEASKGPFAADKLRFEVAQSVPCLHAIGVYPASRSDCLPLSWRCGPTTHAPLDTRGLVGEADELS